MESARNPREIQASRAGAIGATPTRPDQDQDPACMHAVEMLRQRGMDNPEQFAALDVGVVEATCQWFDQQNGRVGVGVLVAELRKGGRRPRRSLVDEQREYAGQIVDWLRENFPEFDRPKWGPHPAAVAEVIRLHHRHGRRLTVREHGSAVRAAVKAWEKRWES